MKPRGQNIKLIVNAIKIQTTHHRCIAIKKIQSALSVCDTHVCVWRQFILYLCVSAMQTKSDLQSYLANVRAKQTCIQKSEYSAARNCII